MPGRAGRGRRAGRRADGRFWSRCPPDCKEGVLSDIHPIADRAGLSSRDPVDGKRDGPNATATSAEVAGCQASPYIDLDDRLARHPMSRQAVIEDRYGPWAQEATLSKTSVSGLASSPPYSAWCSSGS